MLDAINFVLFCVYLNQECKYVLIYCFIYKGFCEGGGFCDSM